jgi:hypothetical protein
MQDYYYFLRQGWEVSVQNILDADADVSFEIMGKTVTVHPRGGSRGTLTVGRSVPQDFGTPDRLVTMLIKTFESDDNDNQEEVSEAIGGALDPFY